jgi:pentafunctional AROM polypeptide
MKISPMSTNTFQTIYLVGMRNVGKTLVLDSLDDRYYDKIDMDAYFETKYGPITLYVEKNGWLDFRLLEEQLLEDVSKTIKTRTKHFIIATGGGIVMSERARHMLTKNVTIFVERHDFSYLDEADSSKPNLGKSLHEIYRERLPWYQEVSCLKFYVDGPLSIHAFLERAVLKFHQGGKHCLIMDDISMLKEPEKLMPHLLGIDLIEFRYDMIDKKSFQMCQLSAIFSWLPIVFTNRTIEEGGFSVLNHGYYTILEAALKSGYIQYVDIEYKAAQAHPDWFDHICKLCQRLNRVIILSYHESEENRDAEFFYDAMTAALKQQQSGVRIIRKVVGRNYAFEEWQRFYNRANRSGTILHYISAESDNFSRALNFPDTPIIYLSLQSTAKIYSMPDYYRRLFDFKKLLPLMPRRYFLIGHSATLHKSLSPFLHQAIFDRFSLPFHYEIKNCETERDVLSLLKMPDFGGASVTVPYKKSIIELGSQDSFLAKNYENTVANTIYYDGAAWCLHNTDKLALQEMLESLYGVEDLNVILFGASATADSIFQVLIDLQVSINQLYVANRTRFKAEEFYQKYGTRGRRCTSAATMKTLIIYTLPLDAQMASPLVWYPEKPPTVSSSSNYLLDIHYVAPILSVQDIVLYRPILDIFLQPTFPPFGKIWNGLELFIRQATHQSNLFLQQFDIYSEHNTMIRYFMHQFK